MTDHRRSPEAGVPVSGGQVYTFHLFPPLPHGKQAPTGHYTGAEKNGTSGGLARRFTDHALGRGARLLQVQLERGGRWVVAQVEPGGFERERQLKKHSASRRCEVCKAQRDLEAGEITQAEALSRAGWDRSTPADRETLLEIFGIAPESAPSGALRSEYVVEVPDRPAIEQQPSGPGCFTGITPEIAALADSLIAQWTAEKKEPEMELEAGA